ncbi:membrane protein [Salmonella enterica subsp. enterica serovar Infantis str. 335-3]|uniref:Putative outer membrane lipoprotein n=1 Tax=Salmonella enterica subsp. enterica serovar Dublin str. SD3246 TaxID=909945 RepID=A0A8X6HLB7_SALDU|nr:putative outer membrane lipoprotein [Salmonella enterica subsp. enterica serovar Dublin str. SD3246]ETE44105.1 membrane protein [Salmonella enterica subsp. enterica serovar Infantis str. 335-3]
MLSYYTLNRSYIYSISSARFINKDFEMFKFVKIAVVAGVLATLTACTGHIENKKNNCSYDYLLHPAISISKIIGGCGPAADQ